MEMIEILREKLKTSGASLVVCFENGEIKKFYNRRVIDIVTILKEDKNAFKNAIVADKVIGKVAASLFTVAGVKEVYGKTMSQYGAEVLEKNNIEYSFDEKVEYIINNDKTGMCPMENKFKYEKNLKIIYDYFINK